ncbi:MAG: aminotransferase class IV [Saprospiraceae bacterium]
MNFNLNAKLLSHLPPELELAQRAVFYGDCLFETIRMFDGSLLLLDRHLERLFSGLKALGYQVPDHWSVRFFAGEIGKIAGGNARIRLTVWRSPGGLYYPENSTPQFLITASELNSSQLIWREEGIRLGICETVRLPIDDFSRFKTLNGARYVAAALEARSSHWDDGLVRNTAGRIAEATSSNVFWWEKECLFTPPLAEGCVAGTMRDLIIRAAGETEQVAVEKMLPEDVISEADEIFLTNAIQGIVPVRIFAGKSLPHDRTRLVFDKIQTVINALRAAGADEM